MPKYVPITANEKTYSVTGITGGVAGWQHGQDRFDSGEVFTVLRREPKASQTTRKSTVRLNMPLVDVCETTCTSNSRGTVLAVLDFTSAVSSTSVEREATYDDFVALLLDPSVREAIVNNESFYG